MSVLHKFKSIFNKKGEQGPSTAGSSSSSSGGGPHIWPMSEETKASLARGVKYNLRVALRGMRRTGKTSLMARLADRPLDAAKYAPTPEIGAATIYFAAGGGASTTEGAKVELWDIVDEALPPPAALAGPKGAKPAAPRPPAADASTVDVYRGCSAVVFLIDATRRETLDYVTKLLPEVPPTIAVLLVLNFCDADEAARVVTEKEVDELCRGLPGAATRLVLDAARGESPPKEFAAAASWMPCSMRSGLGVDAVRAFLDVPFALAQLEALEGTMRGLYRGVDAVRADMMQRRAEARFQIRQASLTSQDAPAAGVSISAGTSGAMGSGSQFSAGSGSPPASPASPQQAATAAPRKSTSPVQQQQQQQAPPPPVAAVAKEEPASPPPTAAKKKPSGDGKKDGGVNDSFFTADDDDDDDADDEPEEEPATTSEDDDDDEEAVYPATTIGMSGRRSAGSPASAGRSPNTAGPPAPPPAAAAAQQQQMPPSRSGSNRSVSTVGTGDAAAEEAPSPAPRVPPRAAAREAEETVPSSLPTGAERKQRDVEAAAAEPQQMSNDVNVVDTSVLEPARVDDDFFGGDDDEQVDAPADEEEEEEALEAEAPTTPAQPPSSGSAAPAAAAPEGAGEEPGAEEQPPTPPPEAPAKPAAVADAEPAVDVAALLAQMQSTFEAAPVADDDDGDYAGEDGAKKKHKKEKKDKSGKKEKKEKKEKKDKKAAAANDGPAFGDDEDDDLQVMEA